MKIDASDRVVYAHNPLAEVVCQVQFDALPALTDTQVEHQVTYTGSFSRQRSGAPARYLSADSHDVAWRKHVCDTDASPDVDSLTETAEAVMTLVAEHGPARLNLQGFTAAAVQGEHLATLLRASFSWRDQVPGWHGALRVAEIALKRASLDPEDALFGLI